MCIYEIVTVPFVLPVLFIMIQDFWQIKLIGIRGSVAFFFSQAA